MSKIKRPIVTHVLLIISLSIPLTAFASNQVCNAILEHGITDIVTSSNASDFEQYLHQSICYERSGTQSEGEQARVNALFDVLSFGLSRGVSSVSAYREKYCSDDITQRSGSIYAALTAKHLSSNALAAWSRCVVATTNGWQPRFDPIDERTVTFGLNYTGDGIVRITGVRITSDIDDAVSCHTGSAHVDPQNFEPILLSTEGWSMTCERSVTKIEEGGQAYRYGPRSTITVLAGGTVFSLALPEYRKPSAPDELVEVLRRELHEVRGEVIPRRTIVAWYPTSADIEVGQDLERRIVPPAGWLICDGTNQTPDLRDRFIYGTTNIDDVGGTGGSATHNHGGSTGRGGDKRGVDNDDDHWPSANEHTHTIDDNPHLPPFVRMVYIMKQ